MVMTLLEHVYRIAVPVLDTTLISQPEDAMRNAFILISVNSILENVS